MNKMNVVSLKNFLSLQRVLAIKQIRVNPVRKFHFNGEKVKSYITLEGADVVEGVRQNSYSG